MLRCDQRLFFGPIISLLACPSAPLELQCILGNSSSVSLTLVFVENLHLIPQRNANWLIAAPLTPTLEFWPSQSEFLILYQIWLIYDTPHGFLDPSAGEWDWGGECIPYPAKSFHTQWHAWWVGVASKGTPATLWSLRMYTKVVWI